MGSLKQYTELYDAEHERINRGSAGALNERREEARHALIGKKLPNCSMEGYEKTSIDHMFAPDLGVNIDRINVPCDVAAAFKCGIPNVSTLLAVLVNDSFVPSATLLKNMPSGVKVMSLSKAASEYPQLIERYYGSAAQMESAGTALNTMLAQDGVFIHVDRNVELDRPIQVVTLTSTPVPMLCVRRMLIVTEPGARLSVLTCDHSMSRDMAAVSSQVIEVIAGEGSRVDLCDIEETHPVYSRYNQVYVMQHNDSDVSIGGMTLHNGTTRNEYSVNIMGEGCHCHLNGMAIGSGKQHIDNCSDVRHVSGHSESDQLFKYVLDDEARGAFEGSIVVEPGAAFTQAHQTDRNILASRQARMHAKPQLLIYNDDVKCSHGATTGQLDERQLFYMQSRGIPYEEARLMLMQAFMTEVVDTVRVESVRDRLRHLVERRLAGYEAHCESCKM
ncbi:MAG: Fe-S cluster assembly protein SufD [Clostridiales bacterium]|nr:Fe-S cluster assembly protein SufD [Clostridiales bacterium]